MASALQTVVLGTRTSCETKARFAALAAQQGLSESVMLRLLVERALLANGVFEAPDRMALDTRAGRANDRVTLRLRPGDRALADAKAATRRMRTSSYLAMLVRAHVRSSAVMPPAELEELRCMAGHLAAMGRQLRKASAPVSQELLVDVGNTVESVREAVAGVVRRNLNEWEGGNA